MDKAYLAFFEDECRKLAKDKSSAYEQVKSAPEGSIAQKKAIAHLQAASLALCAVTDHGDTLRRQEADG